MLSTPPYLDDIRSQPAALQELLGAGLDGDVTALLTGLDRFDRIIMTGMGASLFAHQPAFLQLAAAGFPVWVLETSELLGAAGGLITGTSLLWITSQSGSSGEVGALLERLPRHRPTLLGVTKDTTSDLALGADVVLELHSGEERTVGTRSYVNTLAAQALAAGAATGQRPDPALFDLPTQLVDYLEHWDEQLESLARAVTGATVFIVGRGASMAAVQTGALIIKEASKVPAEGMSAPQFRHGPLELVGPDTTVIHLAGERTEIDLNHQLALDVARAGGNSVWLASDSKGDDPCLPAISGANALPIAEILPLQLLSVLLAERSGVEPGAFRHIEKITRTL